MTTTSPIIPFPTAGTVLTSARGSYTIGALIGDGQYGSVYEAIGPFDQLYALKMFRPANRHYETVKMEWSAEMKRLESFRHPNIVYIYDAFEFNFLFYIALERCDTSLRALTTRPFPDAVLVELTRQLLVALDYLHDNGLVHSDLHGGNVLVSRVESLFPPGADGTPALVKITDFGVSHQLESDNWFRPQVANPKILTPELVTAGYTTRQSDLYQLGLLMFAMHTGESAIPEGTSYHELTRSIAEGFPRQRAEALGTPIGNVIAKLLRRRDAYRYQLARDVWEDLRLLVPGALVHTVPPSLR
ncbi:MAG: serine/threonine protein kinase [Deltaproteobacteria bacterium]|nr:serine/threonine protein kinase [Deltaproteobacteria bacterium]